MAQKPSKQIKPVSFPKDGSAGNTTPINPGAGHNMKPTVILVGADKGGVGKTTITRALLNYLVNNNVFARAFDTESPRGTLHRFHPDLTSVVDLTSTSDQMKIIDTLNTAEVRVSTIDVRAGGLGPALRALDDTGFLEAVKEGEVTFMLFHVLGSSIASLDEISEVAPYVEDALYYLVKNHVNDTTFFEWDPLTHLKYFEQVNTIGEIVIPKLNEMAYEQVDLAGVTFKDFIDNKAADGSQSNFSFVLRGYVRRWCYEIDQEFDRLTLLQNLLAQGRTPAAAAAE
jgi:hypothetical protein